MKEDMPPAGMMPAAEESDREAYKISEIVSFIANRQFRQRQKGTALPDAHRRYSMPGFDEKQLYTQ